MSKEYADRLDEELDRGEDIAQRMVELANQILDQEKKIMGFEQRANQGKQRGLSEKDILNIRNVVIPEQRAILARLNESYRLLEKGEPDSVAA